MLSSEQRAKVKATIQKMIDEGASEDTIKEFTAKVKAKYDTTTTSQTSKPVEQPKQKPTWRDAIAPSVSNALKNEDKAKVAAWKVNPAEPDFIDAPGGRIFNSKKYQNPERTKTMDNVIKGSVGDALSFLPRAAGTAASQMGETSATDGKKSIKESMADPETHIFRSNIKENMEGFKNGKGAGRYIDLLQGIGYDALGDPSALVPFAAPAKVAKGANLVAKAGNATAGTMKSFARGVSGIAGKTADKEAILDYAAKRGIDALESSKPMDELFMELNSLSETESLNLKKILQNSKGDLIEAIEKKKEGLAELTNFEKDQFRSAIQEAKDKAEIAGDAVKKSVQKGRDEIGMDVETKSSNFKADKEKAKGKYESLMGGFKEELTQDIPNAVSRDTKKKVYSKYDAITDPIEEKVSVDFTGSPNNPLSIVDGKHKYGTPSFDKFKKGLREQIETRLPADTHSDRMIVPGETVLKEKKLFQDLADGTFGEVTNAEKSLYKDLAHGNRSALEEAASKAGNPEYVQTMRDKANVTKTFVDAEDSFLPKNLSKDLEVHQTVRTAVEKVESTPELMEKLKRLDAALTSHGIPSTLSAKASEMVKFKNGADLAKSGKIEDLEKLRAIDPELAEDLIRKHQEVGTLKDAGSKLGRVKSTKDMEELAVIKDIKPDLYKEIKDRLEKANIAENDIAGIKRLRDSDPTFAKKLDQEVQELAGMKKASRGLNKVSDANDMDMLSGLEKINPKLADEIKDKLKRAQVAGKGKAGLQSMASMYRKGIGAEDLRELDKFYGTNFYDQAVDARTMVDLGAGNSGRIPGFGTKERTGVSQLVPNALGSAGAAVAGPKGAAVGYFLGGFVSSPRKAVQMTRLANGITKLSDMPVALDKIIAAAEAGNTMAVLRWLEKNGLSEEK